MTTEQELRQELSELKSWDRVESVEVDERVPGCYWLSTSGHGYLSVPRAHKYGKLARKMAEYGFKGYFATYLEEDCEAPAFLASVKALEHAADSEDRYICGACGWKHENIPAACHCGNDADFEKLKFDIKA